MSFATAMFSYLQGTYWGEKDDFSSENEPMGISICSIIIIYFHPATYIQPQMASLAWRVDD